jgi:hypothetical protein
MKSSLMILQIGKLKKIKLTFPCFFEKIIKMNGKGYRGE